MICKHCDREIIECLPTCSCQNTNYYTGYRHDNKWSSGHYCHVDGRWYVAVPQGEDPPSIEIVLEGE